MISTDYMRFFCNTNMQGAETKYFDFSKITRCHGNGVSMPFIQWNYTCGLYIYCMELEEYFSVR